MKEQVGVRGLHGGKVRIGGGRREYEGWRKEPRDRHGNTRVINKKRKT